MSVFEKNSKDFQRQLAQATKWMIRRNVGHNHFWRWSVLTSSNTDRDATRPIFTNETAQEIFAQLESKKLLTPASGAPPNAPTAYYMVYDLKGWEDVISEGDPVAGFWLKAKRKWWIAILTFVAGVLVGSLKDEAIGIVKGLFHRKPVEQKAPGKPTTAKTEPPKVTAPGTVDYSEMDGPPTKKAADQKSSTP